MISLPLWGNALVFAVASIVIWRAGTRLERLVDKIATRTGIGQAFAGVLLLAVATSLPEVATTVSAVVFHDNPTLAVHNLTGGVALQTALLVIADAASRKREALTSLQPRYALLMQGVGLILLLQLVIAGAIAGGVPTLGPVSLWSLLLGVGFIGILYVTHHRRGHPRWAPASPTGEPESHAAADREEPSAAASNTSSRTLWLQFAAGGAVVLVAGWAASGAADALAEQTGIGSAFVGATLLALATSLPELSTTISASRGGRYPTAISNVFGSNAFDVTLLLLADLLFLDGAIMAHAGSSAVFVAAIGATMTCAYLGGMMERLDRTIAGIGWDSVIALATYVAGVVVLYIAW